MSRTKKPKVQPDGTFGWDELAHLVDPKRVKHAMQSHFSVALRRVGLLFERRAAEIITREKPFKANAALTIALKGSTTPLVDHGDLVGSLTSHRINWMRLRMGVRSKRLKGGRYLAEVLHNGATIQVTDAMRRAVFGALRRKLGPRFDAFAAKMLGAPAKSVWIIPPRPFLATTFNDAKWQNDSARQLIKALDESLSTTGGKE